MVCFGVGNVWQATCAALRGDGQLMAGPPLLLCLPLPAWPELLACMPAKIKVSGGCTCRLRTAVHPAAFEQVITHCTARPASMLATHPVLQILQLLHSAICVGLDPLDCPVYMAGRILSQGCDVVAVSHRPGQMW